MLALPKRAQSDCVANCQNCDLRPGNGSVQQTHVGQESKVLASGVFFRSATMNTTDDDDLVLTT